MGLREKIDLPLKFLKRQRTVVQTVNFIKYRLSPKAELLKYSPIVLCVSPTDRCNLRCDMCQSHSAKVEFNRYRHQPAPDMSYEMFVRVADTFEAALSLQLIGTGEPILNKDFFRMVEYAARTKKMPVSSISNGILVDRYLDEIVKAPLSFFSISLNGHHAREFNRLTGQGEKIYRKICDNIAALTTRKHHLNTNVQIAVSFIIDQDNYPYMEAMIRKAEDLGADEAILYSYISSTDVPGYTAQERSLFDDLEDLKTIIKKIKSQRFKIKYQLPALLTRKMERKCDVYFTHIRVDGNGEVGACGRMLLNLSGNGRFDDRDVWNNEYYRKMRAVYLNPRLPLPQPCGFCINNALDTG